VLLIGKLTRAVGQQQLPGRPAFSYRRTAVKGRGLAAPVVAPAYGRAAAARVLLGRAEARALACVNTRGQARRLVGTGGHEWRSGCLLKQQLISGIRLSRSASDHETR